MNPLQRNHPAPLDPQCSLVAALVMSFIACGVTSGLSFYFFANLYAPDCNDVALTMLDDLLGNPSKNFTTVPCRDIDDENYMMAYFVFSNAVWILSFCQIIATSVSLCLRPRDTSAVPYVSAND